ncbi:MULTISPECIES: hypothetical protein [unclassified Pseudomonas]|nr:MULTISPECIES: hypothetical protein [unclassified Pseudomonas]
MPEENALKRFTVGDSDFDVAHTEAKSLNPHMNTRKLFISLMGTLAYW